MVASLPSFHFLKKILTPNFEAIFLSKRVWQEAATGSDWEPIQASSERTGRMRSQGLAHLTLIPHRAPGPSLKEAQRNARQGRPQGKAGV